jgi:hypothetical protein
LVGLLCLFCCLSGLQRILLRRSGGLLLLHATPSLCLVCVFANVVCHASLRLFPFYSNVISQIAQAMSSAMLK